VASHTNPNKFSTLKVSGATFFNDVLGLRSGRAFRTGHAVCTIKILYLTSSIQLGIIGGLLHKPRTQYAGDPTQEDGMSKLMWRLWSDEEGQDIAEYAVMLAVILVLVVGTVRLIGSNANNAFSEVASSIQ
jgi:Flp pilus assembly pilin Flp